MKLQGTLVLWNPEKHLGFVVVKEGTSVQKYFLTLLNVSICEPDVPFVGCRVLFEISPRKPKYPTDLPYAANAEIYVPTAVQS